jgi:DnaJ-class molecular chaperone
VAGAESLAGGMLRCQRGHAAGGKRERASAASGSIKANKKERAAYELLELDPTATDKQIRTAYRKLALKWHPDKNDPSRREEVQAKFIAITAAFQLISGEGKK